MNKMGRRVLFFAMMISLLVIPGLAMAVEVTPANIATTNFNENGTYVFVGSFTSEVTISASAGMQMTFDATNATFDSHVKISIGQIVDSINHFSEERTGQYVINGFKVNNSLSVGGRAIKSLTIQKCDVKALDMNISNSTATVQNNAIKTEGKTYKRYDGGNNTHGLYVYSDHYDLSILNNEIVTTGAGRSISMTGNYEQFQMHGYPFKTSLQIKGNILQSETGIFKIYNDVTYAPVEWPADFRVTDEMTKLAEQIMGQNKLVDACKTAIINVLVRAQGKVDEQASEENLFADIAKKYQDRLHDADEPVMENQVDATSTSEGSYDLVTYCKDCKIELKREHVILPKVPENMPSTGDNSHLALFAALLALCGAGMTMLKKIGMNR